MRKKYISATEIGIRLQHSNEQLEFIRRYDPELYRRILEYLHEENGQATRLTQIMAKGRRNF